MRLALRQVSIDGLGPALSPLKDFAARDDGQAADGEEGGGDRVGALRKAEDQAEQGGGRAGNQAADGGGEDHGRREQQEDGGGGQDGAQRQADGRIDADRRQGGRQAEPQPAPVGGDRGEHGPIHSPWADARRATGKSLAG